jgi:hypothetical protein
VNGGTMSFTDITLLFPSTIGPSYLIQSTAGSVTLTRCGFSLLFCFLFLFDSYLFFNVVEK